MKLSEAVTDLERWIIRATYNTVFDDKDMLESAINKAHQKIIRKIISMIPERYLKVGTALNITGGTATVTLPTDLTDLYRLEYLIDSTNDVWVPMREANSDDISTRKGGYAALYNLTMVPYIYTLRWTDDVTAVPTREIELSPTPTANETGTLRPIYHYQITLTNYPGEDPPASDDYLQLPDDSWNDLCILEALNILYRRDPSIFQNYNFAADLRELRRECFASLYKDSARPRKIRRVV